jgi:transcriptional regulator with XRE-family HTH domain
MYSKELIELYLKTKNYTQHKQLASDMEISKGYMSDLWREKVQLTDEQGVFIAIECGIDPAEVLLKLAEARAKTPQTKTAWAEAVKRFCAGREAASCAGLSAIAALSMAKLNFALCRVMVSAGKVRRFTQHA